MFAYSKCKDDSGSLELSLKLSTDAMRSTEHIQPPLRPVDGLYEHLPILANFGMVHQFILLGLPLVIALAKIA